MKSAVEILIDAMFFAVPVVLCLALYSLVMLCANWKTEHRMRHAKRFGVFLASLPLIAAAIYVTTWYVMMPLLGDELTMQHEAAKAERFSETTLVSIGDPAPEFTLKTLSGEVFVAPQRDKVVVVTFFATWCGPCQALLPILKDVKDEVEDAVKVVKIDIDKNNPLAMKYQVRSVPTMILFVDGEPKWRQSGVLQKKDILNVIQTHSGVTV